MNLPGYDSTDDWILPPGWFIMDAGYAFVRGQGSWGVRLGNERTGQITSYYVQPMFMAALDLAITDAALMPAPTYAKAVPTANLTLKLEDLEL